MEQNQQSQAPAFNPQGPDQQSAPQFQPNGARPMLGFWEAVKICWAKCGTFKGRARRSEYWWFCLFIFLVMLLPLIVAVTIGIIGPAAGENGFAVMILSILLLFVIALVFLIPSLAVMTRRLHDTGRSGWWVVWSIITSVVTSYAETAAFGLTNYEVTPTTGYIDMFKAIMENSMGLFIVVALLYLINLGISIALFVFSLLDSHREENKYGPSPKYQ